MQRYIKDVLALTHSREPSVRWNALQLLVTFIRQGMGHPAEVNWSRIVMRCFYSFAKNVDQWRSPMHDGGEKLGSRITLLTDIIVPPCSICRI